MRRLPVFLVVDVSESMAGDNLRSLQEGMERLIKTLRSDPYALETAYLSVIAFAGRAKTLSPLVELVAFYPPRLPQGSGTSIGGALEHLMDEIDRNIKRSSAEQKGDFKPLVFLMTDGKSTDDMNAALSRWKRDYASRVNLVAVGIGRHADLQGLSNIAENVLRIEAATEQEFKRFIDWISASVSSQSRSVSAGEPSRVNLAKLDDSIMKKIDSIAQATAVDEDFVIVIGKCQTNKLPYLMKFEKMQQDVSTRDFRVDASVYNLIGVYAAERDFEELSDPRANARTINTDALLGAPGCPHCGAPIAFAMCGCGQVFCVKGQGMATCPGCHCDIEMRQSEGGFDVTRGRG
ncbi:MAG: VWA domain-containing protein [Betaproteobacteria bacterium]|nr:VWA domain-containing protein [Betaproteobacteria bacterium]